MLMFPIPWMHYGCDGGDEGDDGDGDDDDLFIHRSVDSRNTADGGAGEIATVLHDTTNTHTARLRERGHKRSISTVGTVL